MRVQPTMLFRVGIFVGGSLAIVFLAVSMLGRERSLFVNNYDLKVLFQDVSGLRKGAFVQLGGLNVGYVNAVGLSKDEGEKMMEVGLQLNQKYQGEIREDSVFSIQTQGLLGDKYVYITVGSSSANPLAEGTVVRGKEKSSWLSLAVEGSETLVEVRKAAETLRGALETIHLNPENKEKVNQMLGHLEGSSRHLETLMAGLEKGEGTLGALLKDPSLYHDVRSLLGHANRNKLLKNWIQSAVEKAEEQK